MDHFPGFSDEELYVIVKSGCTCVGQITHDRERISNGEQVSMGKYYYIGLRATYQSPHSVVAKLIVKNEGDPEDGDLLEALSHLCEKRRSNEELILWCECVKEVNQMSIVGFFKAILKFSPFKSEANMVITIAVMKMVCRLELDQKYAAEVALMNSHWDAAASRSLQSGKNHGKTGESWWHTNQDWAKLVLPYASVHKVFSEKGSLVSISDEVDSIVQSSETGKKLLGHVQRQVVIDRVAAKIDEEVVKLMKGDITTTRLLEAQAEWVTKMQNLGYNPLARFVAKHVVCQYRSEKIDLVVTSNLDHYCTAVQACTRGLGVQTGALPSLWCENDLISEEAKSVQKIDEDCLRQALASRTTLKNELDDEDASNENIMKTMQAKKSTCRPTIAFVRWSRVFGSLWQGRVRIRRSERQSCRVCLPQLCPT